MDRYYVCPKCGFKQLSNALHYIKCHRCGHHYLRRKADRAEKKPDSEAGTGFFKFSRKD